MPLVILLFWATLNFAKTWLLMPEWIDSYWYYVPELTTAVLAFAFTGGAAALAGISLRFPTRVENFVKRAWMSEILLVSWITVSVALFWIEMGPRPYVPGTKAWKSQVWDAVPWIEANIPKTDVLGAWAAGLLGYILNGHTVVNLDGLANSSEFVERVHKNQQLYSRGLYPHNAMWEYIQRRRIRYLAQTVPVPLGKSFWGVPMDNLELVYDPGVNLTWSPGTASRFLIVRVSDSDD
jgi:hypothetical protein